MQIETERLRLRPVTLADTGDIARIIFSDPAVVGMLAHNTKDPGDALAEAERWTSIMGADGDGGIWDEGGMGLFVVQPKNGDGALAGVAGFYMERNEKALWSGEYFYALGSAWHGQGLMSEAAAALAEKLQAMEDLGIIYAAYWDMINEASGRLLLKTGLKPRGRKPVTEEYSSERCQLMFEYDLWRLGQVVNEDTRAAILVQASRRAGAFVAEDVIQKEDALKQLSKRYGASELTADASSMFARACAHPGMAYLEIRGSGVTGAPVNRLG